MATRLLRSWKGIAAYLGVSSETARKYETRCGMPVMRAGPHRTAFAWTGTLDKWITAHGNSAGQPVQEKTDRPGVSTPAA